MTSFFFSRSSLSKNNNNDDDSKETLSSPSALRYAKKKKNIALLNESENSYFLYNYFPTKNKERQETKKRFITLISIRTVYSTQYLRKKRHQKHLLSSERHATRQQQLRHKTFRANFDRAYSKLPAPVQILLFFNNKKVL